MGRLQRPSTVVAVLTLLAAHIFAFDSSSSGRGARRRPLLRPASRPRAPRIRVAMGGSSAGSGDVAGTTITTTTTEEPSSSFFLSTPPAELSTLLDGSGRAKNVWKYVSGGGDPFGPDALAAIGRPCVAGLAAAFPAEAAAGTLAGVVEAARFADSDGTTKLLVALHDGLQVETVLIPTDARTTLCVSSQVGCARGCVFCSTGRMGLVRNLRAHEILAQLRLALAVAAERGLPPGRDSMREVANGMRAANGPAALIEALFEKAQAVGADATIESVRTEGEVFALRATGHSF